jgi:hypothetical protein
LLGNGDGSFQAPQSFASGGTFPNSMVVGDFNADGVPDLAVANSYGTVNIFLGNGDGSFQAPVSYPTCPFQLASNAFASVGMAVADVNGDGVPELVAVFLGGVLVLQGNGDGTFQPTPISYLAGILPGGVAIGDFNGDGKPDVAVANYSSNGGVSILINDGNLAP